MATFQAIGLNLAIGSGVLVASLVAFSAAVQWEFNAELAPRTWARPKGVLKNALRKTYGIAWIPWALRLSYKQMLSDGIPGTGTRQGGWAGPLLKCNLDGVILMKFHSLCLKVSVVASLLCLTCILPINVTATCYPEISGEDICTNITSLTNFEKTTLAAIPPMDYLTDNSQSDIPIAQSLERYFLTAPGVTSRLFVIVIVAWAIFVYTCVLIWNEWIENLALRRVFYLEHCHFEERQQELTKSAGPLVQDDRPPYIPHPELPDTVPNVALYSVLYKLPEFYTTAMSQQRHELLASTVDFFDRCVPNQPGFSSSVAALTILPDCNLVGKAWRKWYACAKKLRRLQLIQHRIRELQQEQPRQLSREVGVAEEEGEQQERHEEEEIEFIHPKQPSPTMKVAALSTVNEQREDDDDDGDATGAVTKNTVAALSTVNEQREDDDDDGDGDVKVAATKNMPPRVETFCSEDDNNARILSNNVSGAVSTATTDTQVVLDNDGHEAVPVQPPPTATTPTSFSETDSPSRNTTIGSLPSSWFPSSITTGGSSASPLAPYCLDSHVDHMLLQQLSLDSSSTGNNNDNRTHDMNCVEHANHQQHPPPQRSPDTTAKLDMMFLSDDDVEQLAVFYREFAQSSAGCCPYGCAQDLIENADLETLKELENEAEEMVREARLALIEARVNVNSKMASASSFDIENIGSGDWVTFQLSQSQNEEQRLNLTNKFETDFLNSPISSSASPSDRRGHPAKIGHPPSNEGEHVRTASQSQSLWDSTISPQKHRSISSDRQWEIAGEIADENRHHDAPRRGGRKAKPQRIPSGRWHIFDGRDRSSFWNRLRGASPATTTPEPGPDAEESPFLGLNRRSKREGSNVIGNVVDYHAYAVVTFTSRQAAIAARQCTADGSGLGRWEEVEVLPIPPLADSPPWDIFLCRACCRPVTLTINDSQKRCRKNITWLCLGLFCCLYTIPLSLTSSLFSPARLSSWFPSVDDIGALSGVLTGLLYTGFFSVCPFIFKAFANFGSGATSEDQAEFQAIRYYWFFVLATAFTGSSLATMITSGLYSGLNLGASAQEVLRQVAKTIPTQVSATWLNWIIVRFLFTIPVLYFLQTNTFLFKMAGMECCARCTRGGGPGGPLPFRIYVDSGSVFLCVVALAPACPMVAPAGMLYFLVMTPVLRWILIFVHRPQHDGGGQRWPLLHEVLISSMIVAQILLTTMMVLKKAYGPAFLAGLSIVPTWMFSQITKERFLRCYVDAGLVQTSELDGWDVTKPTTWEEREAFRKWLVDCHKASYVPICLAGLDNMLTAEPAYVFPTDTTTSTSDNNTPLAAAAGGIWMMDHSSRPRATSQDSMFVHRHRTNTTETGSASIHSSNCSTNQQQRGALFRRVPHSVSTAAAVNSHTSQVFSSMGSSQITLSRPTMERHLVG